MSTSIPPIPLPLAVRIQLAGVGDGLRSWFRLRRIWDRTLPQYADSPSELSELAALLEDAFDRVAAEAETVAARLQAHAGEIDAAISARLESGIPNCSAPDAARRAIAALGPDPAGALAERLRALPALRAQEFESLRSELETGKAGPKSADDRSTAFCSICAYQMHEALGECDQVFNPQACADADKYIAGYIEAGCVDFP
jgi:hypothetical protein